ncbi:unnamed protein product [Gordionus sp. m RMFG-2023]
MKSRDNGPKEYQFTPIKTDPGNASASPTFKRFDKLLSSIQLKSETKSGVKRAHADSIYNSINVKFVKNEPTQSPCHIRPLNVKPYNNNLRLSSHPLPPFSINTNNLQSDIQNLKHRESDYNTDNGSSLSASTFTLEYEEEYDDRFDRLTKFSQTDIEGEDEGVSYTKDTMGTRYDDEDDIMSDVTQDRRYVNNRKKNSNAIIIPDSHLRYHYKHAVPFSPSFGQPHRRHKHPTTSSTISRNSICQTFTLDKCTLEREFYNDIRETSKETAFPLRYADTRAPIYKCKHNVIGSVEDIRKFKALRLIKKFNSTNFATPSSQIDINKLADFDCDIVQNV